MAEEEFYVGQIFIDEYPSEAATFCNNSKGKYYIAEIEQEDEHRRFKIVEDIKTLDELKTNKIAELKTARDTNEQDYFIYDGNKYDSDPVSCQRITDTVLLANAVGDGFSIIWTDYDNIGRELDKAGINGLLVALATHSQACHTQYNLLKEQVINAQTADEVAAVVWQDITE